MKPIIFHPEATEELEDAISFYEAQKPGLGQDLLTEVEKAVSQVQQFPSIGVRYGQPPFRQWVLRRFPYLVFYLELPEAIWILAVAHGKRKPGYWKDRALEPR